MTPGEQIDAIRSVRVAAHDLQNVCAAIVGGKAMAVSVATVGALGRPARELALKQAASGEN